MQKLPTGCRKQKFRTKFYVVARSVLLMALSSPFWGSTALGDLGEGLILHSTFDSVDISGGVPNPNDPSAGAIVADLASSPQNGTIVDSPVVPAISIGTGIIGQAIDFPGLLKRADYPELEADETNSSRAVNYGNNFDIGTENFTISFWFNINTATTYDQLLVSRGGNGTTNEGWSFAQIKNAGAFRIILNDVSGSDNRLITAPSGTVSGDTWTHAALTIMRNEDGTGTIVPYLNGVNGVSGETPLFSSNSANGFTLPVGYDISLPESVTNRPFYVGRRGTTSTPTNGLIDDLGVWNRALSDAEIQEIYANGLSGISLPAAIVPELPGDHNGDFVVNLADYTVWRDSLGATGTGLAADGDGSELIDELDYQIWKDNFGESIDALAAVTSNPVPEPSALLMAGASLLAAMGACGRFGRDRKVGLEL